MINVEKFKKFKEKGQQQDKVLLAILPEQFNQAVPLRNKNPVIKDMETEILDMGCGGWDELPQQEKERLRRIVWQR